MPTLGKEKVKFGLLCAPAIPARIRIVPHKIPSFRIADFPQATHAVSKSFNSIRPVTYRPVHTFDRSWCEGITFPDLYLRTGNSSVDFLPRPYAQVVVRNGRSLAQIFTGHN